MKIDLKNISCDDGWWINWLSIVSSIRVWYHHCWKLVIANIILAFHDKTNWNMAWHKTTFFTLLKHVLRMQKIDASQSVQILFKTIFPMVSFDFEAFIFNYIFIIINSYRILTFQSIIRPIYYFFPSFLFPNSI